RQAFLDAIAAEFLVKPAGGAPRYDPDGSICRAASQEAYRSLGLSVAVKQWPEGPGGTRSGACVVMPAKPGETALLTVFPELFDGKEENVPAAIQQLDGDPDHWSTENASEAILSLGVHEGRHVQDRQGIPTARGLLDPNRLEYNMLPISEAVGAVAEARGYLAAIKAMHRGAPGTDPSSSGASLSYYAVQVGLLEYHLRFLETHRASPGPKDPVVDQAAAEALADAAAYRFQRVAGRLAFTYRGATIGWRTGQEQAGKER
ncbi:MAG TPA: hypothetical protein VJB16_00135, partial [archaeon]|nr:hypothetical protein [archaeon]